MDAAAASSRRKQSKPARRPGDTVPAHEEQCESGAEGAEEVMEKTTARLEDMLLMAIERRVKLEAEDDSERVLQAGETLGPYPARLLASPKEGAITVTDAQSVAYHFAVSEPLLRSLSITCRADDANCVLVQVDSSLCVMVTRAARADQLAAVFLPAAPQPAPAKPFACDSCKNASFSSLQNLQAHQKHYCQQEPGPSLLPAQLPSVAAHPALAPPPNNVIFLPLAHHDHPHSNIVQLLGPPQLIVPVAVGRGAPPPLAPLLVNPQLYRQVAVPDSVSLTAGDLAVRLSILRHPPVLPFPAAASPVPVQAAKRPPPPSHSPLDLSKRKRAASFLHTTPREPCAPSPRSEPAASPPAEPKLSSEPEKPFTCSCGVSFSAEGTLDAHRKYYCKNAPASEQQPTVDVARKAPSRCSQCEFVPLSAAQLSNHMRTAHSEVQAYVCKECGYRGFSLRGIRAHLRTHTHLDQHKFDALLATHVDKVRAGDKKE